jgi:5'-nucleotidase/UDP-sugar diphosphatase
MFWITASSLLLSGCKDKDTPAPDTAGDTDTDTDTETGDTVDDRERVTILHTNDWQSHMLGWGPNAEYSPESTGDDTTVGGLARLSTLVTEIRGATAHPVVLYDGGDWMGGSLFQELRQTHAAELQVMEAIGYDAVCIGNHELDWGADGLGELIATGDALGVHVPILAANLHPDPTSDADDAIEVHYDSGRIEPWRIDTLDNGLVLGLVGLLGESAYSVAPAAAPMTLTPPEDDAAEAVAAFEDAGVDLIIAITHNGVTDDARSPDNKLAAAVPELDVIVGGHSHTPLSDYRTEGSTIILQAGAYTRYLGELVLARDPGGEWEVESYELHELDDTIAGDPAITSMIDAFRDALDDGVLSELGLSFDQPVAALPGDVAVTACAESGLGDFVTDAYRYSLSLLDPEHPIEVALESQGVIRDDFIAGQTGIQAFSDAFRVLPLGEGFDGRPGYPLVSFYVDGSELTAACEVTATVSSLYGCNYFAEQSGMRCVYGASEPAFGRVQSVEVWDEQSGGWVAVDQSGKDGRLYHVAVDSYVGSLLGSLNDLTYGLLVITPKDADGVPLESIYDGLFDADPKTEGVQEVKLWEALLIYSESLSDDDGDGIPDVPEAYEGPQGRLIAK